jgi:transketolase
VGGAQVPQLVSGSADLEPSTLTEIEDGGSVERGDYGAATCTTACASTAWARS